MMKKRTLYTEVSYLLSIIFIAFGTALEVYANFGMSTAVAPAYLLHLKLSQTIPWFSFGIAEYCIQFCLLLVMMVLVHRFRISYLFSFLTAILYGLCLDLFVSLVSPLPDLIWLRISAFAIGTLFVTSGVSFIFHTYLSPEVYELFVAEVSAHFHIGIPPFKTGYDIASCIIAVLMSFLFFSQLEGIGIGTVISACINGTLIGWFTKILEHRFVFTDRLKFRKYFASERNGASHQ
ncbi:MAG: DUF6198 family protein [Solobacterium sp.]|jgi:uncharacterized membrane protein YczE|nr:DUF6198 family protein [Solobacterium sp.]MCH4206215.1 DUF6198 family protein [Solobacterium sp.]MCH4227681.1 DUF6198 family protein [Solobacterium sp.]MCH4283108.1 DUF6198 family protein [Solobacterium sp.]